MRKAKNKCQWLIIGSTDLCGRPCMNEYCVSHNVRISKGSKTMPCTECGIGVKNKFQVCVKHGYRKLSAKDWKERQKNKANE